MQFFNTLRRPRPTLCASALLLALAGLQQAQAGMFDDEEARRQIKDLSIKSNERLDTLGKAQFELVNQIQALREENAKLRGQIETLTYELESAKKRQQDFYVDLDDRLRRLEPQTSAPGTKPPPGKPEGEPGAQAAATAPSAAKKPADPAAEARDYEAALNLLKANKTKDAAQALETFTKTYPDSTLAPNAFYWLGNAQYTLNDCKRSVETHKQVLAKWPQHPKAPDSLVNIATCQQEQGDAKGAKATLETVLVKYPDSPAAAAAKARLKKK